MDGTDLRRVYKREREVAREGGRGKEKGGEVGSLESIASAYTSLWSEQILT